MEIANRIRQRREEKGLTLTALASSIDISKSSLSKLETGQTQPSARTIVVLAAALGTTIEDLMGIPVQTSHLTNIPDSLREFVVSTGVPANDMTMLAGISYRGKRPQTVLDWWFLYEAIKRSVGDNHEN